MTTGKSEVELRRSLVSAWKPLMFVPCSYPMRRNNSRGDLSLVVMSQTELACVLEVTVPQMLVCGDNLGGCAVLCTFRLPLFCDVALTVKFSLLLQCLSWPFC